MPNQPSFRGQVIKGSGIGKAQGIPTVNLDLTDVPADVEEGIYAARVTIEGETFDAAVHYGPRPVHGLGKSFEAHLLGKLGIGNQELGEITIQLVKRLRDVKNFGSERELKEQITMDIAQVRQALNTTR